MHTNAREANAEKASRAFCIVFIFVFVCSYWQNSPAHYANITNASFTSMGVACWFCSTAEGQYTYWTVTFN